MLFLLFQAGKDRYAIGAREVVEVVPLVRFKSIPHAPHWVAGVFSYRGTAIPVVDLTQLMVERPSRGWMSTRIIVVSLRAENGEKHLLGLLAEKVRETVRLANDDFREPGVTVPGTRYLGKVAGVMGSLVQKVDTETILDEDVRALLFRERTDG